MAIFKAQVTLRMTSNIPEDSVVNTYWFESSDSAEIITDVPSVLGGAYEQVKGIFPSTVKQNGHGLKIYSMADPEPRAPIYDNTFNLSTAPTGNPVAPELALCVSFQGERASGQSQARRRGRVYLGPHDSGAFATDGRPHADVIAAAAAFGQFLFDGFALMASGAWVVWSPTSSDAVEVDNGWVDNAWDIQRRRGVAPTARTTYG